MANVKISGLPTASTPLTGAELVPVVQSGVTSKTTIDNIFEIAPTPNVFAMKNRIINGAMVIAQRGTSFSGIGGGSSSAYPVDRFGYGFNSACIATVSQDTSVPSSNQFQYSAKLLVTTPDTSIAATEYVIFQQVIEGYNVRDLIGQTFTLSFWVKSSVTGTYCVGFRNTGSPSPSDRSYVAEYTISAANTWEQKTITVTGGLITAGTWDWTNGQGLVVTFVLAAGSNYYTTAGAWQTGNFVATSNQVNAVGTASNVCAFTGVQLEKGSTATAFEYRPIGLEAELCERYYTMGSSAAQGWSSTSTSLATAPCYRTTMRAVPTVTLYNVTGSGTNIGSAYVPATWTSAFFAVVTGSNAAGANSNFYFDYTAAAEL